MGEPVQLPCAREGAILRTDHCAECCSDSSCPRCWVEGAELTLEHVPLPVGSGPAPRRDQVHSLELLAQLQAQAEAAAEPDPTQLLAR